MGNRIEEKQFLSLVVQAYIRNQTGNNVYVRPLDFWIWAQVLFRGSATALFNFWIRISGFLVLFYVLQISFRRTFG